MEQNYVTVTLCIQSSSGYFVLTYMYVHRMCVALADR